MFTNAKGLPLSDHYLVSARFEWKIMNDVIAYD
jgi:hypothetical protein